MIVLFRLVASLVSKLPSATFQKNRWLIELAFVIDPVYGRQIDEKVFETGIDDVVHCLGGKIRGYNIAVFVVELAVVIRQRADDKRGKPVRVGFCVSRSQDPRRQETGRYRSQF